MKKNKIIKINIFLFVFFFEFISYSQELSIDSYKFDNSRFNLKLRITNNTPETLFFYRLGESSICEGMMVIIYERDKVKKYLYPCTTIRSLVSIYLYSNYILRIAPNDSYILNLNFPSFKRLMEFDNLHVCLRYNTVNYENGKNECMDFRSKLFKGELYCKLF